MEQDMIDLMEKIATEIAMQTVRAINEKRGYFCLYVYNTMIMYDIDRKCNTEICRIYDENNNYIYINNHR